MYPVPASPNQWFLLAHAALSVGRNACFCLKGYPFPDHLSGKDGHSHSLTSYTYPVVLGVALSVTFIYSQRECQPLQD